MGRLNWKQKLLATALGALFALAQSSGNARAPPAWTTSAPTLH